MGAPTHSRLKRGVLSGIRAKLVFALLLTAVPMVALVGYFGLAYTSRILRERAGDSMNDLIKAQARGLEEVISVGVGDVLYRARAPHVLSFAQACASATDGLDELTQTAEAEFGALLETHGAYGSAAFVDAQGRERARVSFVDRQPLAAAVNELADVAGREYFRRAVALGPGRPYVGPLELDGDTADLESSRRPVVRFAAAVADATGVLGVVVLTADAGPLLPNALIDGGATYIVDSEGWYLFHTTHSLAWSGPRNLNTGHRLQGDLGERAAAVLEPVEDVILVGDKIIATRPILFGFPYNGYAIVCIEGDQTQVAAELHDYRRFFWTILAISFAAPALAGLLLATFFLRPVRRLRETVHTLAGGDLTSRVTVRSGDEFEDLANDFNTMAERLQEYQRNERATLVGRMARTILHDIKNPLSSITVFSKLLAKPDLPDDERAEVAERTTSQVDRILMMLQEILEFSRGEGGRIERESITFADVFTGVTPALEALCADSEIDLIVRADIECVLSADKAQLQRALANMTTNACEAMADGGALTVEASCDGDGVTIDVLDTGPGLGGKTFEQLVEPFVTHGKSNGTGLGLAIAAAIIKAHGGTLTGGDRPEGGARFTAWLPTGGGVDRETSQYVI